MSQDTEKPPDSRMFGDVAATNYDRCPAPDFSPVIRFLDSVIPSPGYALDVGCGTGSLLRLLADRGWSVEGCDPSSAMVRAARAKNPGMRITRAGTADFRPSRPPSLITSTFDVVNHLPSLAAIAAFFRRAKRSLAPGGTLVFDTVTPDDIDGNWSRYVEVDRMPSTVLVRSGRHLGPARGSLTYEFFTRCRDGRWRLEVERHILRSAPRDWFESRLKKAGFTRVRFVDAATLARPGRRTVRWLIAASTSGPLNPRVVRVRG